MIRGTLTPVKEIRLKLSDILEIDRQAGDRPENLAEVTAYVLKHYAFLPKPIAVTLDGDEVVIAYPEESETKREEAARLAARAVKWAQEGNYQKAVGVYKRVLELQPSFHAARRDLAMAYVEMGDVENATNHLIEVLRLDPKDAWNWVVLGNLYVREKADPETGEKLLRKALEIKPDDAWALNSLAAIYQKKGDVANATKFFDKGIRGERGNFLVTRNAFILELRFGFGDCGLGIERILDRSLVGGIRDQIRHLESCGRVTNGGSIGAQLIYQRSR